MCDSPSRWSRFGPFARGCNQFYESAPDVPDILKTRINPGKTEQETIWNLLCENPQERAEDLRQAVTQVFDLKIESSFHQLEKIERKVDLLRKEIVRVLEEKTSLQKKVVLLGNEKRSLTREREQLSTAMAALMQQYQDLKLLNKALLDINGDLKKSWSWHLTKKLRVLGRFMGMR